jgi:hypothetical protein
MGIPAGKGRVPGIGAMELAMAIGTACLSRLLQGAGRDTMLRQRAAFVERRQGLFFFSSKLFAR